LEEARTLHLVQRKPHPKLVCFEGCLVNDGRIIGLLLKRYSTTLSDRIETKDSKALDRVSCFRGIADGLKPLHSLAIAHNDVDPENVMLDEEDRPVIFDLGSCKIFGERPTECGTPPWNDGVNEDYSRANNDQIGLRKVGEWLGILDEVPNLVQVA
jgi:serine/threonine protein kinase